MTKWNTWAHFVKAMTAPLKRRSSWTSLSNPTAKLIWTVRVCQIITSQHSMAIIRRLFLEVQITVVLEITTNNSNSTGT